MKSKYQSIFDDYEERAAIFEYDAHFTREKAENMARACIIITYGLEPEEFDVVLKESKNGI